MITDQERKTLVGSYQYIN